MTVPAVPPWWARWWVGASLALVLLGVVTTLSHDVRRQITLSTSRVDRPFVELYFADEQAARGCIAQGGEMRVEIAVRSHLQRAATLRWTARIGGVPGSLSGELSTRPGEVSLGVLRYRAPSAASTLQVRLDGRPERLILHCPADDGGS